MSDTLKSSDNSKGAENKISELEAQLEELKTSVKNCNEHLVTIRHMLTRMEINENDVINEYRRIKPAESLFTMMSYANNNQLMRYHPELIDNSVYVKYQKLLEKLEVYKVEDKYRQVRIGTQSDGGYMAVDNFDRYPHKILYSMGVGGDVSFEEDMANRGFQAYMYDHTVEDTPAHHPNFHFFRKGLIGRHDDKLPELMTIEEMLKANGHSKEADIFLKCDIEGYEIDVINETPSEILNKFTEIVMELHCLTDYSKLDGILEALGKLNETHKLVHVHPNNLSRVLYVGDLAISDCIEITYVRAADYKFSKMSKYLSGKGDYPCSGDLPERLFYYAKQK